MACSVPRQDLVVFRDIVPNLPHRLADADQALEHRERDVAMGRFLKEQVAEPGDDLGPVDEVVGELRAWLQGEPQNPR